MPAYKAADADQLVSAITDAEERGEEVVTVVQSATENPNNFGDPYFVCWVAVTRRPIASR